VQKILRTTGVDEQVRHAHVTYVREVIDNRGYKAESNTLVVTITLQNSHVPETKTMFIHKNHKEVIQLPMDYNRVPQLHLCPTGHMTQHPKCG